jgi:hypothetical protein
VGVEPSHGAWHVSGKYPLHRKSGGGNPSALAVGGAALSSFLLTNKFQ